MPQTHLLKIGRVPPTYRGYPSLAFSFIAILSVFSGATALRAQDEAAPLPAPARRVARPAPVRSLNNLKEGLDATNWDPSRRGTLLVLEPQSVQPWMPERDPEDWYSPYIPPQPLPAPDNDRGYPVETVAPYFGRKMIRLGSITVLAPTEMVVLNTRLPKPDPFAGMRRGEKMQLLQASLTDDQWKTLASENGLGASDLSGDQRDLFLSLLPNPIRVMKGKSMAGGGMMFTYSEPSGGPNNNGPRDPRITLTDAQRASIRIRVNRQASLMIPSSGNPNSFGAYVGNRPEGVEMYQLASGGEWNKPEAFGVKVRDKVPSRLKPGHLDFDAPQLDPVVSLNEAKTVGELLKRIREATRIEIYADSRVGKLGLGGIGLDGSARSGDILKALAWAITGAYRKVGPLFLLTDDVVGIATRRAYISEWNSMGQAMRRPLFDKAKEQIRAKKPLGMIGFAKDDAFALDPTMMGKIESKWNTYDGRWRGEQMRMSDLPDGMKKQAKASIDNYISSGQNTQRPILTDRVNLTVRVQASMIIPGMGTVEGDIGGFDSLDSMLPDPTGWDDPNRKEPSTDPAVLPARMTRGGTLCVAPETPEQARAMVELAKKRNLKAVWILLPVDSRSDKAILAEATRTGKDQGVAIYAVVRLLQAPPVKGIEPDPATPSDSAVPLVAGPIAPDRDINVLGETASRMATRLLRQPEPYPGMYGGILQGGINDWLLPDAPTTLTTIKRRVLNVAQNSGLAGIVLQQIASPGYGNPGRNSYYYFSGEGDFGYTEAHRLALIRSAGFDPIDLGNGESGEVRTDLPFFQTQSQNWIDDGTGNYRPDPNFKSPGQAWAKMRYDINQRLLTDFYKAVRPELPATIPLIVRDMGEGSYVSWYGTWDAADKLPQRDDTDIIYAYDGSGSQPPRKRSVEIARKFSKTVYTTIVMYQAELTQTYRESDKFQPGSPQAFAARINSLLDSEKKMAGTWDGIVFDLSDMPIAKVSELVLGGLADPKAN